MSAYNQLSVAFWLWWDAFDTSNDMALEFTADVSANNGFAFNPSNASGSWSIAFNLSGGASFSQKLFTRPSAAAWHHFLITMDGTTNPDTPVVYVDGVSVSLSSGLLVNGTGTFANSTLNFMSRNNTTFFGAGRLCEVGIWGGVILGQGEATALSKRYAPPLVRNSALSYYWPIIGRTSPEIELMEGKTATVNGAVQTDHPAIIYASRNKFLVDAHFGVGAFFSPSWAHDWVNPVGVAHPEDMSERQHMTFAIPPFQLLGAGNELPWLGQSRTLPVKAPDWPFHHLNQTSVGPPFLIESPGWFPAGGQLAQRASTYPPPEITGLAFITPTDFAIFPHVPPWQMPIPPPRFNYRLVSEIVERAPAPPDPSVPPPAATTVCSLTLGDLKAKVYEQLDDDGTYYTGNEVRHALNVAQNTFALLTLCIERTALLSVSLGSAFTTISTGFSDFLVPLRVRLSNGTRVLPERIHNLDGLSSTWRNTEGTIQRYAIMGYDLLAVYPHPANSAPFTPVYLSVTYAAMPTQLSLDTETPEIPSEQQIHLVDYACWWLRLKEGGQELANASDWLKRFVEAARKYGDFVRRRSYGQKYDTLPPDLSSFDMGRLDIKLKK